MAAADLSLEQSDRTGSVAEIRDGLAAYEFGPFFQPIATLADSASRWRRAAWWNAWNAAESDV
jgi:hypothetical protein